MELGFKYKFIGLFILSILITGLLSGVNFTLADDDSEDENIKDEDKDGIDDDTEDNNKRDVDVNVEEDEIEIKSKLNNGNSENYFEIKLKLEEEDGLEIELSYKSETEDENDEDDETQAEQEFELEFKITLSKIIEFIDKNGNGLYDPSIDKKEQEYALNSFKTPTHSEKKIEDSDDVLHEIGVVSSDEIFTIRFYISEAFVDVQNQTITPAEMKFDIEIRNFNFKNDTSKLALMVLLNSEQEYEECEETDDEKEGYSEKEEGTRVESNDETGFFTWKETAVIDRIEKPVKSTNLTASENDENEQVLYLIYEHGNEIIHDPKIGVATALITEVPFSILKWIPLILIISSVAVIAVVVIVLKHKRR